MPCSPGEDEDAPQHAASLNPAAFGASVDVRVIDTDRTQGNRHLTEIHVDHLFFRATTGSVAPTAEFSGSPLSGTTPLQVAFTDQSTGAPTSWAWTFSSSIDSTPPRAAGSEGPKIRR